MPNPTRVPIVQPRVPFLNPETGFVSIPWYLFLVSLSQTTEGLDDGLDDVQTGPYALTIDEVLAIIGNVTGDVGPSQDGMLAQIVELQKQVDALAIQPYSDGTVNHGNVNTGPPVIKTTNFTVAPDETWIINNKSGFSCVVTLPVPSISTGRVLHFQNYQPESLRSTLPIVIPLTGGLASTPILQSVVGATATMVSDGTNWIITQ